MLNIYQGFLPTLRFKYNIINRNNQVVLAMGLSRTEVCIFISEVICILFYGLFVIYGDGVNADTSASHEEEAA